MAAVLAYSGVIPRLAAPPLTRPSSPLSPSRSRYVTFNKSVRVRMTYSKDDYDRSAVPMSTLSRLDVLEILQMRREFRDQHTALAGNNSLDFEVSKRRDSGVDLVPPTLPLTDFC
ncbi:hypothetical protein M427DRAFT_63091 [Gonapodya prolifera JEL478]|uniref:Uncharacterized protein n=1 Tax=Gonapodya prolifera (strain JEL478) TaxID=1344416 RepID=A0A138ZZW0_GONPJ|nr:hypothetical protein M427DRAFT_63091 [Gonapodya prolifera JEL478]|eukprot:KXS10040.1 hypothetical protein M427DRAFT_63091 [Gonapodya prolifera JEL478]